MYRSNSGEWLASPLALREPVFSVDEAQVTGEVRPLRIRLAQKAPCDRKPVGGKWKLANVMGAMSSPMFASVRILSTSVLPKSSSFFLMCAELWKWHDHCIKVRMY